MEWYEAFAERVKQLSLPVWEELPDLGLYMDQVITYLQRQYRPLYGEDARIITPAMINNYVKSGLVARPTGKKYARAQIAQLMMLCALKQALSLEDMRRLMLGEESIESAYHSFRTQLQSTEAEFAGILSTLTPMRAAVLGASYTRVCEEMLRTQTQ